MATTVPRTTVAVLLVLGCVPGIAGGVFASLPRCTAGGSACTAWNPLSVVPGVLQGGPFITAGLLVNGRY